MKTRLLSTHARPRLLIAGLTSECLSMHGVRNVGASTHSPLRIYASTPIFADIVAAIGGPRTSVTSVIPESGDPHTYEASPGDLVKLTESDAFIFMGAHLEPFIEAGTWRRAVQDAGIPELEIATRISLIKVDKIIDHGDHSHDLREGDPHVWLDPLKTVEMIEPIATFLTALDPEGGVEYASNAEQYQAEMVILDREMQSGIDLIPAERRKLIVFHDAFTYFSARYGFEVIGVVLKNLDAEPSAKEIVALQETIQAHGVSVIFAEPRFDSDLLGVIVEETGVAVGELLTDTFAGRVDSYLEMMRFNLESLTAHLGQRVE